MFFQLYTVYLIIQDYINRSNEHAFDALVVQDNEDFAKQEDLFSPDLDMFWNGTNGTINLKCM